MTKGPGGGVQGLRGVQRRVYGTQGYCADLGSRLKQAGIAPARFIGRHGFKVTAAHHLLLLLRLLLLLLLLRSAARVHGVEVLHHAAHTTHLSPVVRKLRGRRWRRHGHARRHGPRDGLRHTHLALALALSGPSLISGVARPHVHCALHQDLRLLAQFRLNGEQDHEEHHEDVDDVEALVLDAAVSGKVNDDAVNEVDAEQHGERLRKNLGHNGQAALVVVGVGHVVANDVYDQYDGNETDGDVLQHVHDFALGVLVQPEHLLKEAAACIGSVLGGYLNGVHGIRLLCNLFALLFTFAREN
jgi:hypothetical protein